MQAIQKQPDLEQLFKEVADDVVRYFSRRHGDGSDTPQDLLQETFLEMARGVEKGAEIRSLRGYLFGIARRVSQAAWTRRAKERDLISSQPSETFASPDADHRIDAAFEVIASLPALQREILELRFTQQLSYSEIAEALCIPIGTVRSRLHHAIAAVRDRFAAEETVIAPPHES